MQTRVSGDTRPAVWARSVGVVLEHQSVKNGPHPQKSGPRPPAGSRFSSIFNKFEAAQGDSTAVKSVLCRLECPGRGHSSCSLGAIRGVVFEH